jgi:hypothetical protein
VRAPGAGAGHGGRDPAEATQSGYVIRAGDELILLQPRQVNEPPREAGDTHQQIAVG